MTRRTRLIAITAGTLAVVGIGWYATEVVYLRAHREIASERERLIRETEQYTDAARGTRDARVALRDLGQTMLAGERTVVEHRLRNLLSELAQSQGLAEVIVTHGRPRVAPSPAADRGSGVSRGLRRTLGERQDFAVVDARLQGLGSLDACLRVLALARAQPWLHRIEGFSLTPKGRERTAYEIKIDLATIFAPDLVPADAAPPAIAAASEQDTALVARLAARDPFRLVEPVVAVAEPPPPPPAPKPVSQPAPPAPPYDRWRVVGVLEVIEDDAPSVLVMLARTDGGDSRTLKPGEEILGARLESAGGETAVFLKDGALVRVRTGQTLAQAEPAESVHSARTP